MGGMSRSFENPHFDARQEKRSLPDDMDELGEIAAAAEYAPRGKKGGQSECDRTATRDRCAAARGWRIDAADVAAPEER